MGLSLDVVVDRTLPEDLDGEPVLTHALQEFSSVMLRVCREAGLPRRAHKVETWPWPRSQKITGDTSTLAAFFASRELLTTQPAE